MLEGSAARRCGTEARRPSRLLRTRWAAGSCSRPAPRLCLCARVDPARSPPGDAALAWGNRAPSEAQPLSPKPHLEAKIKQTNDLTSERFHQVNRGAGGSPCATTIRRSAPQRTAHRARAAPFDATPLCEQRQLSERPRTRISPSASTARPGSGASFNHARGRTSEGEQSGQHRPLHRVPQLERPWVVRMAGLPNRRSRVRRAAGGRLILPDVCRPGVRLQPPRLALTRSPRSRACGLRAADTQRWVRRLLTASHQK